jgi:rSAM/selenodomain-associated transferase 1
MRGGAARAEAGVGARVRGRPAAGPRDARIAAAVVAKLPRPGAVKTRLCPPLTAEQAAALSRGFLLDKLQQVRDLRGAAPVVVHAPAGARAAFARLAPGFRLVPQRDGDLGARLAAAAGTLFGRGHAGVMFLDTDTPTLPAGHLAEAVRVLAARESDVVLGPTDDGGYYLIGLAAPAPALFAGIPWSTPDVLGATVRRARALGLRVRLLPGWFDVDTGADLVRLEAALRAAPGGARHTRAVLARRPAPRRADARPARRGGAPW